jgi:hypothetical protein
MADKNLGLKSTLRLAPKVELKKSEPNALVTEQLVNAIHNEPEPEPEPVAVAVVPEPTPVPTPEPVPEPVIETKRITLDIPVDLYRDLKMNVFDKSITLRRYLLDLIAKDLGRS